MLKKIALIFIAFMLFVGNVHAADFSATGIERFIKAYQEMIPYFNELDDELDGLDGFDDGQGFDLETLKQGFMDAFAQNRNLHNIVKKHGYSSPAQFSEKGACIIRAYFGYSAKDGFKEFDEAISQMSPEEQQAFKSSPMFQTIMASKAQIEDIPEAHIKAIEPYVPQLNELFDAYDEDDDDGYGW